MFIYHKFFLTQRLLLLAAILASGLMLAGTAQADPKYTTDLSPWGPIGFKSTLHQSLDEPRYMSLTDEEQDKIAFCTGAQVQASGIMFTVAALEVVNKRAVENALLSARPFGEIAKEELRKGVDFRGMRFSSDVSELAIQYGRHYGYQYWQECFNHLIKDPMDREGRCSALEDRILTEFWPLCLEHIPTACFEKQLDQKRCLNKLIHPSRFPHFEEVSDLYRKVGVTGSSW